MAHPLAYERLLRFPKVLLHDHLDGGLRPQTVIELAQDVGYKGLPTQDPGELANWFTQGAYRNSLELYLEGFTHTVAVMQTRAAIIRVASECVQDLAADGVVYAEIRFAPELSVAGGLTLDQVVQAMLEGLHHGAEMAAAVGRPIVVGALLCAMRQIEPGDPINKSASPSDHREFLFEQVRKFAPSTSDKVQHDLNVIRSMHIAELAIRYRDAGVLGFDIAGPEAGYEPKRHIAAFNYMRKNNGFVTIHAGEAFGVPSIKQALHPCGAHRLGHGVRIVDDVKITERGEPSLGRVARYVRDARVPLELCPTSNVHTGVVAKIEDHPINLLAQLGFRATINTDNRLMSGVSMTSEFHALSNAFGYGAAEFEWFTVNAMKSAFIGFDQRAALIDEVIIPAYAKFVDEERAQTDRGVVTLKGPARDVAKTAAIQWGIATSPTPDVDLSRIEQNADFSQSRNQVEVDDDDIKLPGMARILGGAADLDLS